MDNSSFPAPIGPGIPIEPIVKSAWPVIAGLFAWLALLISVYEVCLSISCLPLLLSLSPPSGMATSSPLQQAVPAKVHHPHLVDGSHLRHQLLVGDAVAVFLHLHGHIA